MESVNVYLTKSGEVASLIACGCRADLDTPGVLRVECGRVDSDEGRAIVPALFHGAEYYYCALYSETAKGAQRYELVVA